MKNTPNDRVQLVAPTPLGPLRLVASPSGLCGAWFVDGQRHAPDPQTTDRWPLAPDHPELQDAAQQLAAYFAGQRRAFSLRLDLSAGTAFQQAVWRALLDIPAGSTLTYSDMAQRINRPTAVRAVGAAIGRNPISLVVPCHRVVGSGGALTGYAGGLDRKAALLRIEGWPPATAPSV